MAGCGGAPPLVVEAPPVEPVRFGLLSAASFADPSGSRWRDGVEFVENECDPAEGWACTCDDPPPTKNFDRGTEIREASPFVVYGSHLCSPLGGTTYESARARAIADLLQGEQRRVEQTFMDGSLGNEPYLTHPDTVDLTPAAGALSIVDGFAALESWAGDNFGSIPTIHAPRGIGPAICEASLAGPDGGAWRTCLGTYVAMGAGYSANLGPRPDAASPAPVAPAGEAWLYVTSRPHIFRSEVEVVPDDLSEALDRAKNDLTVIAERTYVIALECGQAAVRVRLGCGCC